MKILLCILFLSISTIAQTAFVTGEKVNVRSLPNPKAKVLLTLPENSKIQVLSKNHLDGWYKVKVKNIIGWMHGDFISFEKSGKNQTFSTEQVKTDTSNEQKNGFYYVISSKDDKNFSTYFYKRDTVKIDSLGRVQAWIKKRFYPHYKVKNKLAHYSLDFMVFNCEENYVTIEQINFYDKNGEFIFSPFLRTLRDRVVPGSVGEFLLQSVCAYKDIN